LSDSPNSMDSTNLRRNLESLQRILIVRLGAMGDVLHALPAVDVLRRALPQVEIGWVIEDRWAALLRAAGSSISGMTSPERPLVNHLHLADTRAWRKSLFSENTRRSISAVTSDMRSHQYDVALDVQGAIKSAVIARLANAGSVVGFAEPRESAATMFYSEKVRTSAPHVVDQNFALVRALIGDVQPRPKTLLPIDSATESLVDARLAEMGVSKFALLAPTAGWKAKEWPTANFGLVAKALAQRGIASLINFGPGEEHVAQEVRAASGDSAIPFACDLSQLIALTRRSTLFVGGDTGPMHLAADLNVPVVALFGPTDPARNGPYTTRAKVLRSPESVTSYSHVDRQDAGLARITPDEVIAAAEALLNPGSSD
jgi:heptosyltransferase I